jgi:hypothetical protein
LAIVRSSQISANNFCPLNVGVSLLYPIQSLGVVMKYIVKLSLLTIASLGFCSFSQAGEWYEGGTLTSASILEWQKAAPENKLASASDFVATLYQKKMLNSTLLTSIHSVDDLKPYAIELAICIEAASKKEANEAENKRLYVNQTVAGFASICVITMGWGS